MTARTSDSSIRTRWCLGDRSDHAPDGLQVSSAVSGSSFTTADAVSAAVPSNLGSASAAWCRSAASPSIAAASLNGPCGRLGQREVQAFQRENVEFEGGSSRPLRAASRFRVEHRAGEQFPRST